MGFCDLSRAPSDRQASPQPCHYARRGAGAEEVRGWEVLRMANLIAWETWVQRYVGKAISEIRFHEDANMLEIGFAGGGPTLDLPLAGKRKVDEK